MLIYSTVILSAILPSHEQFWSLSRGQRQSLNVNHYVFIIFCFRGHWNLRWISHIRRVAETYNKTVRLHVVYAGYPDGGYWHYRLHVEGDTLKVSLHCCQLIWDKANSNHNNNSHQHKFYMPLPSLLLTK